MRIVLFTLLVIVFTGNAFAQSPLENCAEQFIDGEIENAPTIFNSSPLEPYGTNTHLCYRAGDESFFALESWPEEFSPRWAAYKISPDNFGENGCSTYTRNVARCYFKKETWQEFEECTSAPDPFHPDHMLKGTKLTPGNFSNTGHDRGHIAPRQAFSWDVCGTYQTFSMANMSPQRAFLNQEVWADLEHQALTWGIDHGPIYVVTGTTFNSFPTDHFQVFSDGVLSPSQVYSSSLQMIDAVGRHHANFKNHEKGELLKPDRDAKPEKVSSKVRKMRMPTGYFKVIYKPASDGQSAHAIGFMLPHTFENINLISNHYDGIGKGDEYWGFVSRIALIEEVSGVSFPGIPDELKSAWRDDWFLSRKGKRDLRADDCGRGTPGGVLHGSTLQQRIDACKHDLIQ